jgi:hypothetical protein
MTRLVVCDSDESGWFGRARAASRPGDQWHILLLRISVDRFEQRHRAALAGVEGAQLLDVAALAPDAQRDVTPFVLDLVWRLPGAPIAGTTLGALLQDDGRNLWWSLEVSEKSSFRGRLIERLYQLALVARVIAADHYDELWLQLSDASLADTIARGASLPTVRDETRPRPGEINAAAFVTRYWLRALAALWRWLAVRLVAAAVRWPPIPPGRAALAIFTIYPYWWIQPFTAGATDRFFSAAPADAHYVAWLTWPPRLWRNRRAVTTTARGRHLVPLQRFIRLADAVRLLSPSRFRRLLRVHRALQVPLAIGFGPFDISRLVATEIQISISDAELFFDQLIERALTRYAAAIKPAALLYRVEGQPFENALLAAVRDVGTFVIGFFHSPFGEHYPALRFAPGEIGGPGHGAGRRALPDGMLVCGRTVRRYLEADGYPASRIAECGPQRHAGLVRFLRERPTRAELRARLGLPQRVRIHYVALAIVDAETEGLFACLERALSAGADFRLLIKTHPNRPQTDASTQSALRALGPHRCSLVPAGAGMYEYLAASDTMVCIGSTVAFEAMALGVMPIVYEHPGTFAVTSLRAFEQSLYVVNSAATMERALAEIDGNARGAVERRGRFVATVAGVFGDLETALEQQLSRAVVELAAGSQLRTSAH